MPRVRDPCSFYLLVFLDPFFLGLLKAGLQILRGRGDNFIYQKHLSQDKSCYREGCSNISACFSTSPQVLAGPSATWSRHGVTGEGGLSLTPRGR